MSLIRTKLENIVEHPDGCFNARCPACAALGQDKNGNHLLVRPSGAYSCVVYAGDSPAAKEHRKEIYRLAGDGKPHRKMKKNQANDVSNPDAWWRELVPWKERLPKPGN